MAETTALVWFRRDLRVHDHPALHAAATGAGRVAGVFVLDPALLEGRSRSENRTAFMLACVADLREALRERGSELLVRAGDPVRVLAELAAECGASAVHWTSDVSPFARRRDRAVTQALREGGIEVHPHSGTYVADPSKPRTSARQPYAIFSPYGRQWERQERRPVLPAPAGLAPAPAGVEAGALPAAHDPLPEPITAPGEAAARGAAERVLAGTAAAYAERHDLVAGGSSELSPHLRWGTLSARELEARLLALPGGPGPAELRRQLAWRDFHAHVLLTRPASLRAGLAARAPHLRYDEDPDRLAAWQEGRTGVCLVDAGMRQLAAQGWMHNRARMVTASFLTHDLHLDWRAGDAHFARLLYDYDPAQNALNWQWVAGVGADPGRFLRVFNPATQAEKFDPDGEYVRRWLPEGAAAPMVDHAAERRVAVARWEDAGRAAGLTAGESRSEVPAEQLEL